MTQGDLAWSAQAVSDSISVNHEMRSDAQQGVGERNSTISASSKNRVAGNGEFANDSGKDVRE